MPRPVAAAARRETTGRSPLISRRVEPLLPLRRRTRRRVRTQRLHCDLRAVTLRQILAAFGHSLSEWLRRDFDVVFPKGFPLPHAAKRASFASPLFCSSNE